MADPKVWPIRTGPDAPVFVESQRFRQPWLWAILILSTVPAFLWFTWVLVEQLVLGHPVGDRPMPDAIAIVVWLCSGAFTVALFLLFARTELRVEVSSAGLHVQFKGLRVDRLIAFDEIASFESVQYRPIAEYGGWGVRGLGKKRALNVSGDRGVQLVLTNGDHLLIGSQKAGELKHAIARFSSRA